VDRLITTKTVGAQSGMGVGTISPMRNIELRTRSEVDLVHDIFVADDRATNLANNLRLKVSDISDLRLAFLSTVFSAAG
jgi:hypothetical protein